MRLYAVFINEQALTTAPSSGAQRARIMAFIRSLAANPNALGDFEEQDDAGRTVQVKILGRYAVTFWANHAVCEVKVTHVSLADQ